MRQPKDNSYYQHLAKQQNNSYLALNYANGLPVNTHFYDIAFYDRMLGVVVGENGAYYKTSHNTVSPQGYLTATKWKEQTELAATDTILDFSSNQLPEIYTVAYPAPTSIVIGGKNPQNAPTPINYPYVRQLDDAGGRYAKRMYYDRLGRVAVSQNSRQEAENKFSYTLYDALGRTTEAGEKTENPAQEMQFKQIFGAVINGFENPRTIDDEKLEMWIAGTGERREVTHSYYDSVQIATLELQAISSDFNVNYPMQLHRIIHTTFEAVYDNDPETYDHATHFAYDIHGNVKTLVQDNQKMADDYPSLASQRFKRMDYTYDLISGNVNRMSVQTGEADQWHHAYIYDADNRLTDVYTNTHTPLTSTTAFSHDLANELAQNADWQHDAKYYYYDHGSLARIELGQNALQGIDYFYTLQGWLKGVNSSVLAAANNPGNDSQPNTANAYFAKDVFGFSLHYFNGDYKAINGSTPVASVDNNSHAAQNSADLYNGNIRMMQTALTSPTDRAKMPMLNAYEYDQLNRLRASRSYETGLNGNSWNPMNYGGEYFNAFTYDAMGNILTQERHNRAGNQFDNLSYHYQKDANGNLERNRLYHVNDAVSAGFDSTDIDDMGAFISAINQINSDNNYVYDKEGRLVKDKQEEIDTILWTVTGKVKEIHRTNTSKKKNLIFEYDAFGRRIAKHVYNNETAMLEKSTYYILDAQGNQLSIYEHQVDTINSATLFYLTERNIYGSSRLGVTKDTLNIFVPSVLPSYGWLGNRQYELNNHLGNVLTVINDVKYPISSDNNTVDAYEVGISNIFDYSPFGAPLDGRTMSKKMASTISNSSETAETPTTEEIYNNNFDNPVATSSPYSGTTTTLNAHLSNDSWTSSTGTFTNYASTGAGSGKSIAISSASADTAYITLKFDVENGYQLGIENYSFAHRSSTTGYTNYILTVNGTKIGSGSIYVASAGSTLQSTGLVSALNTISGQTGTVNVVLKLFGGAHGYNGTFRMDNFVLNGYTQKIENSGTNGGGFVVADGYRYGFGSQERDNEISGKGNSYTAEFWQYSPRLGKRWNIDPVVKPHRSPYAAFANNPIWFVDVNGADTSFCESETRENFLESYQIAKKSLNESIHEKTKLSGELRVLENKVNQDKNDKKKIKEYKNNLSQLNDKIDKIMRAVNSFKTILNPNTPIYEYSNSEEVINQEEKRINRSLNGFVSTVVTERETSVGIKKQVIHVYVRAHLNATMVHETIHGMQIYEQGSIVPSMDNEYEAFDIEGSLFPNVINSFIRNALDDFNNNMPAGLKKVQFTLEEAVYYVYKGFNVE